MRAWFPDDNACLDYLDWLRWPDGFCCPHCSDAVVWQMGNTRLRCGGCRAWVSRTAGTIFQDTRVPLTSWFEAAWLMTVDKQGISAASLQRLLSLGSYQTAWTMLHRFRVAMGTTGTDPLCGTVEVDESFLGGTKAGPRGRGALGKTQVAIAVELLDPKGYGRCRIQVIPNARKPALRDFLTTHVELDSLIVSDGLSSYPGATEGLYRHKAYPVSGSGFSSPRTAPSSPPGRVAAQTLAAGHPPGLYQARARSGLPQRVRVPVQPPPLNPARHAVLPALASLGRRASHHLPQPRGQLPPEAEQPPDRAARPTQPARHARDTGRRPPVA